MTGFGFNISGFGSFPNRSADYTATYLVVAGAGCGGYFGGGGGGAGGLLTEMLTPI